MKFTSKDTLATVFIHCVITADGQEWITRPSQRFLSSKYGALISGIRDDEYWCVTAPNGVKIGAKVGFRLCDGSSRQMWDYDDSIMKWRTDYNPDRCMAVGSGKLSDIKDGAYIRIANCTVANTFNYRPNQENDLIKVSDNTNYCMVNSGTNPSSSDAIIIKPCIATGKRFRFSFEGTQEYSSFSSDSLDDIPGCLVVKNEDPVEGQGLIHGDCVLNHNWRLDSSGLFHTELDDNMCMQAVPSLVGGSLKKGVRLRLYSCDANNKYQQFIVDGSQIRPKENESLCVGYQGNTGEIGKDPLILKLCGDIGTAYSYD